MCLLPVEVRRVGARSPEMESQVAVRPPPFIYVVTVLGQFYYGAEASLELLVLWPLPPECWTYRHVPPHPAVPLYKRSN